MNKLRHGLPELPESMSHLPISEKGYPIPFFVKWFDGKPDFRVIDIAAIDSCVKNAVCWCCGKSLGKDRVFVAGPLIAFNGLSAEPPMHRECALYAVRSCPFMLYPQAQRREHNLPAGVTDRYTDGEMVSSNPGVSVIMVASQCRPMIKDEKVCFVVLEATDALWYKEGRQATREEAQKALQDRLRDLRAQITEPDVLAFEAMVRRAYAMLPEA